MTRNVSSTNELLTEVEAAKFCSLSRWTLRGYRRRGLIEHFKFNERNVRYTRAQLEAFLNSYRLEASPVASAAA